MKLVSHDITSEPINGRVRLELGDGSYIEVVPCEGGIQIRGFDSGGTGALCVEPVVANMVVVRFSRG